MENYEILYMLGGIISALSQLVVTVACGLLFFKNRSAATSLMFIGSILSVLFYGLTFLGNTIMAQQGAQQLVRFSAILNLISQTPYILFAVGLLLFAIQYAKRQVAVKNM